MKYAPRFIVYLAITRYLKPEQVACLNYDLRHSDIRKRRQFLSVVERYFDIETLRENPSVWQDVGLYYYLKDEKGNDFGKKGYILQYEKEVIRPKNIEFREIYDSYLLLGIC